MRTCDDRCGANPYHYIECYRCLGRRYVGMDPCDVCDREGVLPLSQCANCTINAACVLALDAYEMSEKGVMPVSGGLLAQTRQFLRLRDFIGRLMRHEENRRVAKAQT